MQMTYSAEAAERLQAAAGGKGLLRLVFDSEGCGCAMNGVPTLWLVDRPEPGDLEAESAPLALVYRGKDEIFFEDKLFIDYQDRNKSYILKSSGQIYNAGMSVVDKRENR
ncbi:iron-sulfur cluster biosynthesis family protein [Paenibacillus athensensis]|nr:iron-sulfur cluster biosynthesis family protein [Paenibacillus athensensis]